MPEAGVVGLHLDGGDPLVVELLLEELGERLGIDDLGAVIQRFFAVHRSVFAFDVVDAFGVVDDDRRIDAPVAEQFFEFGLLQRLDIPRRIVLEQQQPADEQRHDQPYQSRPGGPGRRLTPVPVVRGRRRIVRFFILIRHLFLRAAALAAPHPLRVVIFYADDGIFIP